MSINSSLVKLADKIDADGKSSVSPEYKNPNNSIEKSLERIADNYNGSGGGGGTGGGVLVVEMDAQTMTLNKTWKEIHDAPFAVVHYSESSSETSICHIYQMSKHPVTGECQLMVALGGAESDVVTWYYSLFVATTENDYPVMQQG